MSSNPVFNLSNYKRLLESALQKGYRFVGFDQVHQKENQGLCLLRHDIDADLQAATCMARVENELKVKTTYFLMLRSPCYNLMGRENFQRTEEILQLGHDIGLHYDQGFDEKRQVSTEQTLEFIQEEIHWMEKQFKTKIHAVSFHQPGPAILQNQLILKDQVNTYDRKKLATFTYFSDSNRHFPMVNDLGNITKALSLKFPENIQLLTHPMWWVYDFDTTEKAWDEALKANFELTQRQLLETERAYGPRRNISLQLASLINK